MRAAPIVYGRNWSYNRLMRRVCLSCPRCRQCAKATRYQASVSTKRDQPIGCCTPTAVCRSMTDSSPHAVWQRCA
eukprot:4108009-Alexandrium_andersonii.AAC.1